jgi:hypothetical protein
MTRLQLNHSSLNFPIRIFHLEIISTNFENFNHGLLFESIHTHVNSIFLSMEKLTKYPYITVVNEDNAEAF